MDILRDTNIDFMKYRKFWIWVSGMPSGTMTSSERSPFSRPVGKMLVAPMMSGSAGMFAIGGNGVLELFVPSTVMSSV